MKRDQSHYPAQNSSFAGKTLSTLIAIALCMMMVGPGIAFAETTEPEPDETAEPTAEATTDPEVLFEEVEIQDTLVADANTDGVDVLDAEEVMVAAAEPTAVSEVWYDENATTLSIDSLADLQEFAKLVNEGNTFAGKTVTLDASLDLAGLGWTPIGNGTRSGSSHTGSYFAGTFNGNGNTISNLMITSFASKDSGVGFFGIVDGGRVSNIHFVGASVQVPGSEMAAISVGMLTGGGVVSGITIDSMSTLVASRGHGAIVGRMTLGGTISACTNNANIIGSGANVGGIVGAAYYTAPGQTMTITGCVNNGSISGSGVIMVGGIAGLSAANVSGCTNTGTIAGTGDSSGGIIGEQRCIGIVQNNYNSGTVTGGIAGGIIGWMRYLDAGTASYTGYDVIKVLNNTNSGTIQGLSVSLKASGGIVGSLYMNGVVSGNVNTAPSISSYNFAAGIVGSLQATEAAVPGIAPSGTVSGNISTTLRENITGNCVDLFAYNNNTSVFTVTADNVSEDNRPPATADEILNQIAGLDDSADANTVNTVVNAIGNMSPEERSSLTTEEDSKNIAQLETLYTSKNDMIGTTTTNIAATAISNAAVSGAALSVPITAGQPLHAELVVKPDTTPKTLPDGIASQHALALEVSLNIVSNASGQVWADEIQPTAPITVTLSVNDPNKSLDVSILRVIHYYHEGDHEIIEPLSATRDGNIVTVSFVLTSLSPVILANLETTPTVTPDPTSGDSPETSGENPTVAPTPSTPGTTNSFVSVFFRTNTFVSNEAASSTEETATKAEEEKTAVEVEKDYDLAAEKTIVKSGLTSDIQDEAPAQDYSAMAAFIAAAVIVLLVLIVGGVFAYNRRQN